MAIFIKTGLWESAVKGFKGWFNLDRFVDDKDDAVKEYVDSRPTGGVKSFFFTTNASDVPDCYVAQTTMPNNGLQTISVPVSREETVLAQFITPLGTPDYRVTEGMRFFYMTARVSSTSRKTQLRGEVWTTDLDGEKAVILRRSALSETLTELDTGYITTAYGNSVFIDHTTTRILFKIIAVHETGGHAVDVILSVDDDTYSRLDVPSPVGVTEMILKDDNNAASILNVGKMRYHTTANSSSFDICMQTDATTYEWVAIKQNAW